MVFFALVPTMDVPSVPAFSVLPSTIIFTFLLIIEDVTTQAPAPVSNKKSKVSEPFIFPFK